MPTDWISPPGDTIADLLEEKGWALEDLANRMDYHPDMVLDLLEGRLPIDYSLAVQLGHFLGSTVDFWLLREAQYRAELQRRGI